MSLTPFLSRRNDYRQVFVRWLELEQAVKLRPKVRESVASIFVNARTFTKEDVNCTEQTASHE